MFMLKAWSKLQGVYTDWEEDNLNIDLKKKVATPTGRDNWNLGYLWDELETYSEGNSRESMVATLPKTPSNEG